MPGEMILPRPGSGEIGLGGVSGHHHQQVEGQIRFEGHAASWEQSLPQSRATIVTDARTAATSHQRRGIGTILIEEGVRAPDVVVPVPPEFYTMLGFRTSMARPPQRRPRVRRSWPWRCRLGPWRRFEGEVRYPQPFGAS